MSSHSPLMYGLIKLHSRLDGDLQQQKKNLAHVRAVIKIVSPDFDIASIKPKRTNRVSPFFKRGEAFLLALDVLREAREPMRPMEIAIAMLAKKGVSKPTAIERRAAWNAIKNTMDGYSGRAVIAIGHPHARRWSIKS
ncbi:MAG: hypothetical protein WA776_20355 [Xanthobacteraceae bacterium]